MQRAAGPVALLLIASALLLPALGAAPFERAEIYFLDVARGMAETGDWLVPRYRGEPFFDKPALTYWLMAAAMTLFGPTATAARLVSAVSALGTIAATLWLGALLFDRRRALAGGLVLATTAAFVSFGRLAMSDMLMTLLGTLAMAVGVRAVAAKPPPWALPALGAILGLGFQAKGPIAVLLPGLGLALLAWRARQQAALRLEPSGLAVAAALFAVFGLGWFALVAQRLGAEPLRHFFLRENLERFAGATYDTGRPFWYYLAAYMAVGLPWSLFLPQAVARAREDGAVRVLLLWAALMLVPLSLSRGKIDYYLLPLLPALSLALGQVFTSSWTGLERQWSRGVLLAAAAGLGLLAQGPVALPEEWLPPPALRAALALAAAVGAVLCSWAAWRARPREVLATLAGVTAALFLALAWVFLPAFMRAQPHAAVVEDVRRELGYEPRAGLVICADAARVQRDVLFHARLAAEERCELWAAVASAEPRLFLLDASEQRSLGRALRGISDYPYLPADTLTWRGLLDPAPPRRLYLAANFETEDPVAVRKAKREWKQAVHAERARREASGLRKR